MLTPLIAALVNAGHDLGIVARPHNLDVFPETLVRRHLFVDNLGATVKDLIRVRYDAALIATEKMVGYLLASLARIPIRIGFHTGLIKPFKSVVVRGLVSRAIFRSAIGRERAHECQELFSLGTAFTTETTPTKDITRLRRVLLPSPITRNGSAIMQITEKWRTVCDDRAVAAAARDLHQDRVFRLVGSVAERVYCDGLERLGCPPVEHFALIRPWLDAIAAADFMVTPDTGAAHAAGMLGTRVVDIFADDNDVTNRWRPWAASAAVRFRADVAQRGLIPTIHSALGALASEE